jgi:hypothetical protein
MPTMKAVSMNLRLTALAAIAALGVFAAPSLAADPAAPVAITYAGSTAAPAQAAAIDRLAPAPVALAGEPVTRVERWSRSWGGGRYFLLDLVRSADFVTTRVLSVDVLHGTTRTYTELAPRRSRSGGDFDVCVHLMVTNPTYTACMQAADVLFDVAELQCFQHPNSPDCAAATQAAAEQRAKCYEMPIEVEGPLVCEPVPPMVHTGNGIVDDQTDEAEDRVRNSFCKSPDGPCYIP